MITLIETIKNNTEISKIRMQTFSTVNTMRSSTRTTTKKIATETQLKATTKDMTEIKERQEWRDAL